jgi:hypothetical protein
VCPGNGTGCNGTCDGVIDTQACLMPGRATQCRAPSCDATAGLATLAEFCDGSGACPAARTQTCPPTGCAATSCLGCKVDTECATTQFCRAGVCTTLSPSGATCSSNTECASDHCVDGVCCDTACDGQCEACNVGGNTGACVPVTGNPRGARAACNHPGTLCGGTCDGTKRTDCSYPGIGVVCVDAACSGDRATVVAFCDGSGNCPRPESLDCPTGCDPVNPICADGCQGTCSTLGDYCSGGVCVPRKAPGASCSTSAECASSFCVDGVCCDGSCGGQCEACDVAGVEGVCTAVSGAPHGSRLRCATDQSACGGQCDGADHDSCAYPNAATNCRVAACSDGVATLPSTCQGNGSCGPLQEQSCGAVGCLAAGTRCDGNCTADTDCAAAEFCSGGICVARQAGGATCGASTQCANGHCVDGVCCDTACTGQCEACNAAGVCSPVSGNPRGGRAACAAAGVCGGVCDGTTRASCTLPSASTVCGVDFCASGFTYPAPSCVQGICRPTAAQACDPYQCAADGRCLTGCIDDVDCAPGLVCSNSACILPTPAPDAGPSTDSGVGTGGAAPATGGQPSSGGRPNTGGSGGTGGTGGTDAAVASGGASGAPTTDAGVTGGQNSGGSAETPDAGVILGEDRGTCGCELPRTRERSAGWVALALSALALTAGRRRNRAGR